MRAEIVEEIDGRRVAFRLPIGGLERVAAVNPALEEVRDSFATPVWHLAELVAVLEAGAEYGDGLGAAKVIDALGLTEAKALALRLLNAAFESSAPKKATGGAAESARDSSSPPAT